MSAGPRENPLVVILGPTAVGKTAVSIGVAKQLGAEIVSADSRLVYRKMDIGTDKPASDQLEAVPHHLIDVVDPDERYSLAQFRWDALTAIDEIQRRGRLPLLVGGTGQYLTAIVEGWQPPPQARDRAFRRDMERFAREHGTQALHHRLERVDPARADEIDHRNVRRVIRALEIHRVTGRPASEQRVKEPPPFEILQIGLIRPREELYARIDDRIEAMFERGLLQEVEHLLDGGLSPSAPAMSAIGYRQAVAHLMGELSLKEAKAEMRRLSRQFVRRQANWFKDDDESIHWVQARPGVDQEILGLIRSWLQGERTA